MLRHGDVAQVSRDRRNQRLPCRTTRQKMRDVFGQPVNRTRPGLGVDARVGHIPQPGAHMRIGRRGIQDQALPFQAAFRRPDKTVPEILNETPDLAFGLRPIRRTHAWAEPMVPGKLTETRMEPMLPGAAGIPVGQYRLHVIGQDRVRHTVNRVEEPLKHFDLYLNHNSLPLPSVERDL